jgi:hypothetical protein
MPYLKIFKPVQLQTFFHCSPLTSKKGFRTLSKNPNPKSQIRNPKSTYGMYAAGVGLSPFEPKFNCSTPFVLWNLNQVLVEGRKTA